MTDEMIPASPDQLCIPIRQSDRRNRFKHNKKLRRPRRLQTANFESADRNLSANRRDHISAPARVAHEAEDGENVASVEPSSLFGQHGISNPAPLSRDLAYASARLYALGDTLVPNRWVNRPQPEIKFQSLNELLSQRPISEDADLFEDLVSAVDVESWTTQLSPIPGHKTPPPTSEPAINHFRSSSRCSMALSSTENTPERISQQVTDSDAEELLEQTMRGIVDENDEAGLAVRSQQFSLLSESFEMIESAKWPTRIESTKFSAFSIHEDMDRVPMSAEKRKSTEDASFEAPPKKLHLEGPPSPNTYVNGINCDELFNEDFTQLKHLAEEVTSEVPAVIPSFAGFTKANGGRIQQAALGSNKCGSKPLRKNIFEGIDEEIQSLFGMEASNMLQPLPEVSDEVFQGFQPVSKVYGADTTVKLKADSLKSEVPAIIKSVEKPPSILASRSDTYHGFGGFALASGNAATARKIAPKRDIFAGIDEEIENDFRLGFYDRQTFNKRAPSLQVQVKTPANKRFLAGTAIIPSTSSTKPPSPSPVKTPANKHYHPSTISPLTVLKPTNNRLNTPNKPSPIGFNMAVHLLNDRSSTPISKPPTKPMTLTQELSSCRATFLQDEDEAVSLGRSLEDHEFLAVFAGHNPPSAIAAPPSPRRNKNLRQTKLLHRFETADDQDTTDDGIAEINDSLDENLMALTEQASRLNWKRPVLSEDVTAGRKRTLLAQSEAVASKPECEKGKMPGSVFTKKQGNLGPRQSLKDFFGGSLTQVLKSGSKLFVKISEINAATADTFKFDMEDYFSPEICSSNIDGVALADGATVIFNEHGQAGLVELKAAFMCQPGVSPELVPNHWVENAYKWIIVKLAALELWCTSRSGTLTQCLNPEAVLLQLKYRYDREIDLVQRPAIRKIFEKDDSAAKPMVLFVAQVFDMDIELSDGWYGIRTKLDTPLRHFVKTGRIKVGTKLMIQNAELLGADDTGCSPLEAPVHVRLSIFANSTRVARWDTKLGYCPRPRPLRIPLDSVLENGGIISEAVGCILRVYPMMYVDKSTKTSSGSSVLRSEKVQQRHNLQVDANRLAIIEETYHQVQQEIDAEDKIRLQRFRDKRRSLPTRLTEIKDADVLSDLLEFSNDPADIEAELTPTQKKLVIDHQATAKAHRDADIADRVRAKLEVAYGKERQVCPLLKLRICDARKPEKNMMLSIWRPSADNRALLTEGSFLKMSNVSANAMRYNVPQLTAGSMSKFELMESKLFVRQPEMQRQLTPIVATAGGDFTPFANEFDVVGVVVKIGEMSKFQQVYMADADTNLLIINFWGGVKQFAYDDTVQVRRILYASNVQWRPSDTSYNGVPKSYTTEFTTFKQRPGNVEVCAAIAALTTAVSSVEDFVKKCVDKIDEAERKTPLRNNSLLNRTPTPLSSSSANQQSFVGNVTPREFSPGVGQPRASVHDRIEYLSRIPSPPRVPTFELTWNSNYRRRKVPVRRHPNENLKD